MKFTAGFWENRPGVFPTNIGQVREMRNEGTRVYLYTVPYGHDSRAVGGTTVEVFVSSPKPDMIRIEARHYAGSRRKRPQFDLSVEACPLDVSETDDTITIASGNTRLVVKKRPATFTYYYKDRKLTAIGERYGVSLLSSIQTNDGNYMRAQLTLDIGEKVYGLGERFTPFVKNGQVVDLWNEDGGTCTDITYKNIPFYLTNRGCGVFVNDSGPVSYEICSEQVTRVQFSVPGQLLDFTVIGADDAKGVIEKYTSLTGRPGLPPAWTYGLWLSSSFTTSYDEATVGKMVDGMRERKIPLSVFHFDCFWMKENEWCGFEWDKAMFPDARGFLSRLHDRGLHVCVWINPYIGQKSPLFAEAMEKNYLLNRENGDVWQWDMWQAGMGIVDFTNPDAYRWYQSKLRGLMEQGVDAFKTDFGERIPTDATFADGSEPIRMHNYYTYLYNKCVYEAVSDYKNGDAVVFARSATVGSQKFPVHWGGDCSADYPSMYESLRGGLSLCLSGFAYWSHDISGFEGTADADLYKRWIAFGLLSTHSRLHGSTSYRVPWLFCKEGEENGEESVAVTKFFSENKCSLMPYLYDASVTAHEKGLPVMRAMMLEFSDFTSEDLDRQYMLGERLLVAPVMRADGTVDYFLPEGEWTHLFSNEKRTGGKWQRDTYDYFSLPLYVRENTILPFGRRNDTADYDFENGVTLKVYALSAEAEARVCDRKGKPVYSVKAERQGNEVTVRFAGDPHGAKIVFVNETVASVAGASLNGDAVIPEESEIKVILK